MSASSTKGWRGAGLVYLLLIALPGRAEQALSLVFNSTESPPIWSEELLQGGLGGEILQALVRAAHGTANIHYLPLKRYEKLVAGNRLGNPLYFIGQEFGAVIPLLTTHAVFCYYQPHHPQGIAYQTLSDLNGLTIGVIRGTLEQKEEFERYGVGVEENVTLEALFRKLKAGRVDVVLVIDIMAYDAIEKLFPLEAIQFRYIEVPNGMTPIALMLGKDTPDYEMLAAALHQAMDDK
ncbi:MAG: transporter substrate-binding domain-containing protein [Methylococcaceae bacterium]|nr:transporter substrate-binding domain-containing protein [Methylococcaceae bacterium]